MAPAIDTSVAADNTWRQAVKKEERVRWSHDANSTVRNRTLLGRVGESALKAHVPTPTAKDVREKAPQPPTASSTSTNFNQGRRSSAMGFLEEKLGTHTCFGRSGTNDLLQGSSADGGGRVEYLRRRRKYDVTERYGRPMTEAQAFDLGMHGEGAAVRAPEHGRKAVLENSFFRKMGAVTYKN
eukprot:gb/GFBE01016311.1/.p1 GENE.gb/GFBE01016311.1/~~gb/GFBE01016311.1/.p1  ORF type:complete len:183 (+),score=17.39 gb/GFBE01016311.1/:1-549(+)